LKKSFRLQQPHFRAKLIGALLIIVGIVLFFFPTSLNIKLAFTSILIGLFMIFMITERSIPQNISDAQIQGNLDAIRTITRELNLAGNATFLPKSDLLTEERIFIPLQTRDTVLPEVDDTFVFSTGADGKSIGISVPPSGLQLLRELETEADFEHTSLDGVEEKLQTFVGFNLLKSISLQHREESWKLALEKPLFCTNNTLLCRQFPCPTCSAALTALARSSKQHVFVREITQDGKKTTFHLNIG
jgi:hypothetical protein